MGLVGGKQASRQACRQAFGNLHHIVLATTTTFTFYTLSTFSFFDLLPSLAWGEYLKGLAGRVEVLQ